MKNLTFFILITVAVALSSCSVEDSGDVDQDRIWTRYELFYNANDDRTIAIARFRFGSQTGTLLQLNEDASVSFNGMELEYNDWYLGHTMEMAGFVDSGLFVYQDLDQLTFENTVMPFDTIAFPEDFDTINKNQANTLFWEGNPLAPNEDVELFVGTWTWGEDALFVENSDNATEIVMGTDQLSNLATGSSTVFMERSTKTDPQEATGAGGLIVGKYKAENKNVQIIN